MTLVIGAISRDGIVFGSDSQVQFWSGVDVKRLGEPKIFRISIPLNNKHEFNFLIGGAGSLSDIQWAVSSLYQHLELNLKDLNTDEVSVDIIRDIAERSIFVLHKKYNIDRYREMRIDVPLHPEEPKYFSPILILGTYVHSQPVLMRLLPNGRSELSENFVTIGSGSAYAELLMKIVEYNRKESWKDVVKKVFQVISYAESVDPNVGGPIYISVLKEDNNIEFFTNEDIISSLGEEK